MCIYIYIYREREREREMQLHGTAKAAAPYLWLGFTPCLHRFISRFLQPLCSVFLMRAHGCSRKL